MFNFYEKIVIIFLSILLFVGIVKLHIKNSRPYHEIIVAKKNISRDISLHEIEKLFQEKYSAGKIDINTAGLDELSNIPGLGKIISSRIIEYRKVHGNFLNVDDILKVKGIGQKKLNEMEQYIKV